MVTILRVDLSLPCFKVARIFVDSLLSIKNSIVDEISAAGNKDELNKLLKALGIWLIQPSQTLIRCDVPVSLRFKTMAPSQRSPNLEKSGSM